MSPCLESATSIKMAVDKLCYYNLAKLATVDIISLENVEIYVRKSYTTVLVPSLATVTASLIIGPNSVQGLNISSLVALVSQTLTVYGQTNLSDIAFSSLETVHSLIMYDNNQTMLPGQFGKLPNAEYINLNGNIDKYIHWMPFMIKCLNSPRN